jgi:hypothetical protein
VGRGAYRTKLAVYTYTGDAVRAEVAQMRAIGLYPPQMHSEQTQVQLVPIELPS